MENIDNIKEAEEQLKADIEKALLSYYESTRDPLKELIIDPQWNERYWGSPQQSKMHCNPLIEIKKYL